MRHFQLIARNMPVAPVMQQLAEHPDLWGENPLRKEFSGSPHKQMDDIWVRYNDAAKLSYLTHAQFNEEHVPVWYRAWKELPALRRIVFTLVNLEHFEMIGGVLITKIPPGCSILSHADIGWHVEQYEKYYISLQSAPGSLFICNEGQEDEEVLNPLVGDCWLFDNRKYHSVHNRSGVDRITLIVCGRTDKYGRY